MKTAIVAGARIAWREQGRGEPVLLLHGYPQNHECWRHQFEALAQTHRVIAPDWFGWGQSERSLALASEYGAEVSRLGLLADALGLERFNLFGHDYGGFLGLGYALREPRRILRLAILNSRAQESFRPAFYRQTALQCRLARYLPGLLRRMPAGDTHRRALARYVRQGCFDAAQLERYVAWMDTAEGRRWYVHFYAHYEVPARPELQAGLGRLACPLAVIWGARDPYCDVGIGRRLAAAVPGARLTVLDDADHYVMEQRPRDVLAALQELLAEPT